MRISPLLIAACCACCITPVLAQGQGGYDTNTPGAATAATDAGTRQRMRNHHMTNDTSGGTASIDKSGRSNENGGALSGAHGQDQGMGAAAPGNTGGTKTSPTGQ